MKPFLNYQIEPEHENMTVENYLKQVLLYSGRKIQKLTRHKGIRLNGRPVFLQRKLKAADLLQIRNLTDTSYGVQPEKGTVEILYEDEYLLVLNKPAGLLVHPAGRTGGGTLANYLAYHLQQHSQLSTIRALHRLDRDTSGCVIFAKDDRSQFILEQQLKTRILKRTYWAVIQGQAHPDSGTIDAPIGPHPTLPNRRIITVPGEPAVTHYRTLDHRGNRSLLELTLDTGRTHQIRLHLAHLGCPLLGDGMYGLRSPLINRQVLHAAAISFRQLSGNQIVTVTAPLPADFIEVINNCQLELPLK